MLQNGNEFLLCADHALCSLIRVEKLHASGLCNYSVNSRPDLPIIVPIRIHSNYSTYS